MGDTAATTAPQSGRRIPNLVGIAEAAARLPGIPEPTLRDFVYHAEPRLTANGETTPANGFDVCIVRLGRRVLIDFDALLDWIESHRQSRQRQVA